MGSGREMKRLVERDEWGGRGREGPDIVEMWAC